MRIGRRIENLRRPAARSGLCARRAPGGSTRIASEVPENATTSMPSERDSTGSGRPSIAAIGRPLPVSGCSAAGGARRHGQHGIAGGQRLHRLRQQRIGIRAEAKRPPARHQRQRVRLARRPRQVDRTEIGGGGGGNRRRALAAQMLAQDGDAVEPRRPAAKRRVRQIVGELGRCDLVAFGLATCRPRRNGGSGADNAGRRPSARCPTAPRRRTAASRPPRRSGCG